LYFDRAPTSPHLTDFYV